LRISFFSLSPLPVLPGCHANETLEVLAEEAVVGKVEGLSHMLMIRFDIKHLTGKEIEQVNK